MSLSHFLKLDSKKDNKCHEPPVQDSHLSGKIRQVLEEIGSIS